ncbi:MAG TPA: Spo0B C-terminal domain-containing protein [Bacillales bacterium]|nr:Spo0B C-terminal domain-containing protein [Bacillales bacterium]
MNQHWDPLELLRHSRHDWLNDIQLIKANLSLNRLDRVHEIIEEITSRSQNESKLTNLHIPKVAVLLLTSNWETHPYRLQVEVAGDERNLSAVQQDLFHGLVSFFQLLDDGVDPMFENHVLITFKLMDDDVRLTIDFAGYLKDPEAFRNNLDLHKRFVPIEQYVSKEEFVLTVRILQDGPR